MKPTIIVETILPGLSYEERFHIVKEAGFDAVELWAVSEEEAPSLRALADRCGIEIVGLSGDITPSGMDPHMLNFDEQDAYCAMVEKIMTIAKTIGAKYLHCHSGCLHHAPGKTSEEMFAAMVLALRRLTPKAEQEGLVLLVENCETKWDSPGYYLDAADKVARLIRMVNSPNVRFIYDLYHEQVMQGDLIRKLRENIDIIPYVHVSNVPQKSNLENGEINYDYVARELRQLHFDGPLGFEVISHGDYTETFRQIKRFLAL